MLCKRWYDRLEAFPTRGDFWEEETGVPWEKLSKHTGDQRRELILARNAKHKAGLGFLTHGYSVGVFVSHRHHSISISAFFCVLIASSLLCASGGNRLDQSRTSLVDFSREPVRPVYTLDLLFTCWNLHCENSSAFAEKEFIPVTFLSYTCNYYNRLYLTGTLQRLACIAATIPFLTSVSADNIPFL